LFVRVAAALAAAPARQTSAADAGRDLCRTNFSVYKERLTKNTEDAAAWQELRVCSDLLRRWNEAAVIASEAIDKKSDRAEPHLILAWRIITPKNMPSRG